jgi:hypothetical protein
LPRDAAKQQKEYKDEGGTGRIDAFAEEELNFSGQMKRELGVRRRGWTGAGAGALSCGL